MFGTIAPDHSSRWSAITKAGVIFYTLEKQEPCAENPRISGTSKWRVFPVPYKIYKAVLGGRMFSPYMSGRYIHLI